MINLSTRLEHYELLEHYEKMTTVAEARGHWRAFREERGLCGSPKLLTYPEGQHKLGKSVAYTVGLTLQSADGAGVETCPWRGQCAAVCVLKNGNGTFPHVQKVRDARTQFLRHYPVSFMRLLVHELQTLEGKRQWGDIGPELRCRLNMNSDLRWHLIAPWLFKYLIDHNWPIKFYDYTKNPAVLGVPAGLQAPNYLQVYSINENTGRYLSEQQRLRRFLLGGGKTAMVTNRKKGAPVLEEYDGFPVVDGDVTDDLWSHPEGSIIDLTAKGRARTQAPGFVRYVY